MRTWVCFRISAFSASRPSSSMSSTLWELTISSAASAASRNPGLLNSPRVRAAGCAAAMITRPIAVGATNEKGRAPAARWRTKLPFGDADRLAGGLISIRARHACEGVEYRQLLLPPDPPSLARTNRYARRSREVSTLTCASDCWCSTRGPPWSRAWSAAESREQRRAPIRMPIRTLNQAKFFTPLGQFCLGKALGVGKQR